MAERKREKLADFEIDKLTNSIENVRTQEIFGTEIPQLKIKDIKLIHKVDNLSTINNPSVIQGLIGITDSQLPGYPRRNDQSGENFKGGMILTFCKVKS